MNPIGKIYGFMEEIGDWQFLIVPVIAIFGLVTDALTWFPEWAQTPILILAGIAAVGCVIIFAYKNWRRWREKRAATDAPAEGALPEEEVPSISDDEFRRELARKFDKGVADLASFRKDPYKLPLYLVVGERGCGKSEAIRRSGIGFPAGLTDTNQGVGGTHVLDWWITNKAVLLDLPGAHFFGRGGPSEARAWKLLLKHIADFRPASPLNGIILAISAETLLNDSDEDVNTKSARLVEHFENVHRALGTQVPVFVMVTKSDRLCGFLEYFSDLKEGGNRDQIFGWSNPDSLETPFSPDKFRTDIDGVFNRLRGRRDSLLQYSIESKSLAYKRRVQVNHLYEFPRSFQVTARRLGTYLERIFEPDSWYCAPFFLRGAYYTSAIQRDTELDPSLAKALAKPLAELPAAESRHTEDSYFLKEMLNDKVFCEGGLVTWKQDPRYQRKRARARWVMVCLVLLVCLFAYMMYESNQWRNDMEQMRQNWKVVNEWLAKSDAIVTPGSGLDYEYNGDVNVDLTGAKLPEEYSAGLPMARLPEVMETHWVQEVSTPWVFKPFDLFNRRLRTDMQDAYRSIFEYRYVAPLAVATQDRIVKEEPVWRDEATAALGQLLRIEAMTEQGFAPDLGSQGRKVELNSLLAYAVEDESQFAEHTKYYNNYVKSLYDPPTAQPWPPQAFFDAGAKERLHGAVDSGVVQFKKHTDTYVSEGEAFASLRSLLTALTDFRDAESLLWKNAKEGGSPDSVHEIDVILASWREDVAKLTEKRKALDDVIANLFKDREVDIKRLCEDEREKVQDKVNADYRLLTQELDKVVPIKTDETGLHIQDVKNRLMADKTTTDALVTQSANKFLTDFDELRADREFLAKTDFQDMRGYQLRNHVYGFLQESDYVVGEDNYDPFDYLLDLEELQKAFDESVRNIADFDTNSDSFNSGREAAESMLALIYRQQRFKVVAQIVEALPINTSDFARLVSSRVEAQWLEKPEIPLTPTGETKQFDDGYNTEVVYDLLTLWSHMKEILGQEKLGKDALPDIDRLQRSFKEKNQVFNNYITEYINYWSRSVDQNTEMVQFATWKDFHAELNNLEVYNVNHKLRMLYETALYAVDIVPDTHPGQADAHLDLSLKLKELTEDFDAACLRTLNAWKAIEKVDRDVVNGILVMKADAFKATYLSLIDNSVNKANFGFWNSLCRQGVRLLADEGEHLSRYYLVNLATRYRGFPLINDTASPPLTPEQFDEAVELVRHIKQPPKPEKAESLMTGERTGWPDVDKEIDRLQGDKVIRTEYEREWFNQIVAVMDFIGGDTPLTCELVILPRELQEKRPPRFPEPMPTSKVYGAAPWVYRYMRINGEAFNTEPTTYVVGEAAKTYPLAPVSNKLALHFYYTSEDLNPGVNSFARPSGVGGLEMDWLPIVVLHMGDSIVLEDKKTCAVPFRVVDNAEHKDSEYYYWLGFKFNKDIPDKKNWPSAYNWPSLRRMPRALGDSYPEDKEGGKYINPEAPLLPLVREADVPEPVQTNASSARVSEKIKEVNIGGGEGTPAPAPAPAPQVAPLPAPEPVAESQEREGAPTANGPMPNGAYDYKPAEESPKVFKLDDPRTPATPVSRAKASAPAAPEPDYEVSHAPAVEAPTPVYSVPGEAKSDIRQQTGSAATPSVQEMPAPADSAPAVRSAEPPALRTESIKRPPAIVPAPERPLYTTEVTFTKPPESTKGASPEPPIIGEPSAPVERREAVADPYSETTGPGYGGAKVKKKADPSLDPPKERGLSRSRPGR